MLGETRSANQGQARGLRNSPQSSRACDAPEIRPRHCGDAELAAGRSPGHWRVSSFAERPRRELTGWQVGTAKDAGRGDLAVDQLQSGRDGAICEQTPARAEQDREDVQMELVDQAVA